MVKEVGFLPVRRYEIPAGELLFNTAYSFLSVRFGYGNQLLAFLGLSHWLFIAVLDLFGFSPNFYERHYPPPVPRPVLFRAAIRLRVAFCFLRCASFAEASAFVLVAAIFVARLCLPLAKSDLTAPTAFLIALVPPPLGVTVIAPAAFLATVPTLLLTLRTDLGTCLRAGIISSLNVFWRMRPWFDWLWKQLFYRRMHLV